MTKYLLNLVCIIGIVGAAHAAVPDPDPGVVANLEITLDGHAYLVFTGDGTGQLAGYQIEDMAVAPTLTFLRDIGDPDGTGEFASSWSTLTDHGALAGEFVGLDWFVELNDGTPPAPESWIAEGSHDSYITRVVAGAGAPVYIGKIFSSFSAGDLTDLSFMTMDTDAGGATIDPESIKYGSVFLRTPPTALVAGTTDLAGGAYQQTIDVGAPETNLDVTCVSTSTVVIDLKVGAVSGTTTTVFGVGEGHVMVDGKEVPITFADIVETGGTGHLRVKAVSGGTTLAIDADLTQADTDPQGRFGTLDALGSTMVIVDVLGDFNVSGVCNGVDIDLISALILPGGPGEVAPGLRSLLFDVNDDHAIGEADRNMVIADYVQILPDGPGGSEYFGTIKGDTNLDGMVSLGDFSILANHFGEAGGWDLADSDGNGEIGLGDFALLANNFGSVSPSIPSPAPTPAPEPATMTLLAIGGLALVRRRRRA